METVDLEVMTRGAGKSVARKLRQQNLIPAVVYGKGLDSLPIAVNASKFYEIYREQGHSAIVNLILNGQTIPGIIKEVQYGTLDGKIIHVDFQKVSLEEEIEAEIPIKVEGAGIIESKGAIIQHQLREITVRCRAQDLPEEITVDVSGMDVGDVIKVSDLNVPKGVKVVDEPEEIVLSVIVPRAGEVEETEPQPEGEQ
ncbi:50S ribosomal protein L25 [Caldanaerobius polysaccharolyticus]|uniref:50S ribosomal protein L25 n=1 Tax=Caldanaerobius polysaccharolyticus TaxID=44256 RepID=UPI00047DF3BC|nr:50S ribosomal protein L25 [Caldanaerobius polysaccharolyticus]